jgi:hypothetical protein
VQASTDLVDWATLSVGSAATGVIDYVDTNAPSFTHRFYRLAGQSAAARNILGYATVRLPPGFAVIANPLMAADNSVGALFPNMPDGTAFDKFATRLFKLTKNMVAGGQWANPTDTLVPGEGGILFNPTQETRIVTFVGDVMQGNLTLPIPAGFSLRSSVLPQAGRLDTDLRFPFSAGDAVHLFNRDRQEYAIHTFGEATWEANPPIVGVGEAFWSSKNSPGNWIREIIDRALAPPSL